LFHSEKRKRESIRNMVFFVLVLSLLLVLLATSWIIPLLFSNIALAYSLPGHVL
jgi:hypothetical protein